MNRFFGGRHPRFGPGWMPGRPDAEGWEGMASGGPGGAWRMPPWARPGRGFFGGPRMWPGPRARRGDVRAATLVLLLEQPMNGYEIIQQLAQRSQGAWRASPGSVYPALQQLEDEALVQPSTVDGRRVFTLTEAGRTYVQEHRNELGTPWQSMADPPGPEGTQALRDLVLQVIAATRQVGHAGTEAQIRQAAEILTSTRRSLYHILAEDEPAQKG